MQALIGSIDLPELLQVLGIDAQTREQGRQLAKLVDTHGEFLFSTFYGKIQKISHAYKFTPAQVDSLKKKQIAYWRAMFAGNLDINYVRNAAIVGDVHKQKGIEPLLYIVGYSVIKTTFIELIAIKELSSVEKAHLMIALEKYISLDIGLAMVGYSGRREFAMLFAPGFSR